MRPSTLRLLAAALVAAALVAACGSSKSSTTTPPAGATTGAGATSAAATGDCAPKAGDDLVVLADDKHSQNSDNVVPIVRTDVAKSPLTDALNAVSAALSQSALHDLNAAVSIDKKTSADAAQAFVDENKLGDGLTGGSGKIVVGAANFAESLTLANVYADALKKAGYDATAKTSGARAAYEPALEKGDIQVFPEYAATFTTFLATKQKASAKASGDITATIAALKPLAATAGLTVLDPAEATDQNAFAVTKASADAYGLTSLSDVAAKCGSGVTVGAPAECPTQGYCKQALENDYGIKINDLKALDEDGPITRQALKGGQVLIGEVFSSDADVAAASSG
ncbi:MAG TPA: glycine betaine ABC transporter substrate-binding protein [Mycobacteriales bacterium]|nr:glycine betaine ABC transporter substrate-binding protein [Mycobacteriales bacterium]